MNKRRRRGLDRGGFFVVWGWRTISTRERGIDPVKATCPACREDAAFVSLLRRRWFTLFFLPVAPLDPAAHGQRQARCSRCRTIVDRPVEQLARRSRAAGYQGDGDWSHSIALYNKLRDNPANAAVMLELLQTYEAMNEPGEAAGAARHFPQAFAADPRCRAVLSRMRAEGK